MGHVDTKRLLEALEFIEQFARHIRVCAEALESGHEDFYQEMVRGMPQRKPPQLDKPC